VSTPAVKVLKSVALPEKRAIISAEVIDRNFLIDFRRALLQQLRVVEKQLGIDRRCRHCGQSP
jgi:hypothetical protein